MANLCSFSFRYLYTQWWPGQGGNCSFRGQWGETLEVAFGRKLLGVDEIRSSWYGQHWWSSRWCYHCCSLLEAGIWLEHSLFFFCLIWVVQWLVLIVIHAFQGLFLLYLNFCLSLIFVVFLFLIFINLGGKGGREGEVRGGVLGDWGSRVSCCSYFDSLLSKVLFNCSCYGFLKLWVVLLQFVDEKVQWMHIDLAGPVWNDKKRAATGFGISTLVEWVLKNSS